MPGAGLPAIEAGMPLPGRDRPVAALVPLRTAGLALAVYGASRSAAGVRGGHRRGAAEAPDPPVLVSVFLDGGPTRCRCWRRPRPRYPQLRPTLALAPGRRARPFSEDPRLHWHPVAAPLRRSTARARSPCFPAIGYTTPTSRTSPRALLGGRRADPTPARLDGPLPRPHGAADNPLQGLSLGWDLSPSLAPQSVPVAAFEHPTSTASGRRASGGRSRRRCSRRLRRRSAGRAGDAELARRALPLRPPDACARSSRRCRGFSTPPG